MIFNDEFQMQQMQKLSLAEKLEKTVFASIVSNQIAKDIFLNTIVVRDGHMGSPVLQYAYSKPQTQPRF